MFEFGRDLRKLFVQARESEDLSWLELIGVDLLASEARQQTTDAGRVSCSDPSRAYRRASALWREHARRSGDPSSLEKAMSAAEDAGRTARSDDAATRASLAVAEGLMMRFDLFADAAYLDAALRRLPIDRRPARHDTAAALAGVVARVRARQAQLADEADALDSSVKSMDAAIAAMRRRPGSARETLTLERAALTLEIGIRRRDPARLDSAGQALQALVTSASPDYKPITRARALLLCAAGLCALAALAGDGRATDQGRTLFEAAADQFTPDHSPMDWVAIQVARGSTSVGAHRDSLAKAVALADRHGLILGALARDLALERAVAMARSLQDSLALARMESDLRAQLGRGRDGLSWTVDQIALGRVTGALAGLERRTVGSGPRLALMEAECTARELGVPLLAERARELLTSWPVPA